jgi:hypothetical protein
LIFLIRPKTDIDMPISSSKAHNPLPLSAVPVAQAVDLAQPLQWLASAWRDMTHCGWVSYLHGVVMALVGAMMLVLVGDRFWFMAGAFSGFLLVAPILATSLYALSRALERGETPSLGVVLKTWLNWQDGRIQAWGRWPMAPGAVWCAVGGSRYGVGHVVCGHDHAAGTCAHHHPHGFH